MAACPAASRRRRNQAIAPLSLTKSYEQKQSTLDSLLESGFRLFVTVVGPLVALFTAILRYAP